MYNYRPKRKQDPNFWRLNKEPLSTYLNTYPNLHKLFDWMHDGNEIRHFRQKFTHNREDLHQDQIHQGAIRILNDDGISEKLESVENIAEMTLNLWKVLWILNLTTLLQLSPLFTLKNKLEQLIKDLSKTSS
jgi:hypothetical protein